MNAKQLLLCRLDELHQQINSSDEYDVLKASATIRQLFLDGSNSLVDIVNRTYDRKLEFTIVEHNPPNIPCLPMPDIWCCIDSIDPRRAPYTLPRVKKTRAQFFSTVIGIANGESYSVKDLIKFVANVMGGVHFGTPRNTTQKALEQLTKIHLFPNFNIPLLHIRSIGRVILETLRATKEDVIDIQRFVGAPGLAIHMAVTLHPMIEEKEN